MTEKEKKELLDEIERIKTNLDDYLRIFPILEVSEREKERVINQFLDDILSRKKKLEE